MTLAANTELTHILILTGKVTVIQIHGTDVGAAFPQGFGYELKIFASTGGKKFFTVNLLIEEELIFTVLFRSVYKELHADHETGAADNK